ncbi:protein ABHD15 [Neosynchiropus ocellatus]
MTLGASLLCLLPLLLLLLLSLPRSRTRGRVWFKAAIEAAGRRLWATACLVLDLPESEARGSGSGQTTESLRFVCKPSALAQHLLHNCPSLTKLRSGVWSRGDPHVQTFSSQVWGPHTDPLQITREHLQLADGGLVALDWAVGAHVAEAAWRRSEGGKALGCFTSAPPVLVLIPQHWGGMTPHLKALCLSALSQGFSAVVFHPRGTAGCPLTTARLTEFGDSADLQQALAYIHHRHPSSKMVAVSEGSGSGVLLSYLGESGSGSYLTACVAISPVLLGQRWFQTRLPPFYSMAVSYQRKLLLDRYRSSFRPVLDVDQALGCSSLKDLEETLYCSSVNRSSASGSGLAPPATWALGGRAGPARDWKSYWQRNEPLRDADEVAVPVLCIRSRDDPVLPPSSTLPTALFQRNPFFFLALTDTGGHCGFTFSGQDHTKRVQECNWSHLTALEYFKAVAGFMIGEKDAGEVGAARQASRLSTTSGSSRRRPSVFRRTRPLISGVSLMENEEASFTWRRSYTR